MDIDVSAQWHETFTGGHVGVLLVGNVDNSKRASPLDDYKRQLEQGLREKFAHFSRADFMELAVLAAYRDYYKHFDNTYHVQGQTARVHCP